jgi:DnaK suppressor protein
MHAAVGHCQDGAMNTTSDEKLRDTRAWLVARSAELRERVERVHSDLRRTTTPLPRDAPDAAIAVENDEILQAVEESAHRELNQIDRALERLEAGAFAKCEVCGADIDADRLAAVPYTTYCIRCAKDA